jgi:uncharacterized protein
MAVQMPAAAFPSLRRAIYVSLTTFRKSGNPVVTPVCFAQEANTLYVFTFAGAGKEKRVRQNPYVLLAACTLTGKITGPTIEAQAHRLTDADAEAHAEKLLARKYGITWPLSLAVWQALRALQRKPKWERVYLAIELVKGTS